MGAFADLAAIVRNCTTDFLDAQYGPDATVEGIAETLSLGIRTEALVDAATWFDLHGSALLRASQVAEVLRRSSGAVVRPVEKDTREQAADEPTPSAGVDGLSYQAQQLLAHIRDLPSFRWTTGKAAQVYADLGYPKRGRRHNARSHLHELAARDLLTVHGPHDGRYFLLAQKDGA